MLANIVVTTQSVLYSSFIEIFLNISQQYKISSRVYNTFSLYVCFVRNIHTPNIH